MKFQTLETSKQNSVIERISISAPSKPDAGTKEVVP